MAARWLSGEAVRRALLSLALILMACGGPTSSIPPASDAASLAPPPSPRPSLNIAVPTLPAADEAIPAAAQGEVAVVRALRRDAGIAPLLGADGEAVLAAADQAQATFATAELPALVDDLSLSAEMLPASLAAVGYLDWVPTYSGRNAYTASLLTGVLATSIASADQDRPRTTVSHAEPYDAARGGIRERTTVRSALTLQTGAGRLTGEVELATMTVAIEARTGASIGTLTATARGTIEISGCPDDDGLAAGSISLAWEEELDRTGKPAAGAAASIEAPVRFVNGDDAHLVETQIDLSFAQAARGPGSPGTDQPTPFDWGVTGSLSLVMPAGSGAVTTSNVAVQPSGATDAQVGGAASAAVTQAALLILGVGAEAERFWRSGKCVELKPSQGSREVQPGEEIALSVDALHRFDGAQVDGGIVATPLGNGSLTPSRAPVNAPAEFTYIAGQSPGDKGTIELKQTSRRGIGSTTLEFTVALALSIALDGSWIQGGLAHVRIFLPPTELHRQDDGTFALDATADVSGTTGFPGCMKEFAHALPLRVTVRPDAIDPTVATVTVQLTSGTGLISVEIVCGPVTSLAPVPLGLWVGSFSSASGPGVRVTINQTTTVIGEGGSAGSTTFVDVTTPN